MDDDNSYIELWNMKYFFLLSVYDRTNFYLTELSLRDAKVSGHFLFVLNYNTGIYKLKLVFESLIIDETTKIQYYSRFAVMD